MIDVSGLERLVEAYAEQRMVEVSLKFRDLAREMAPYRTGELSNSIEVTDVHSTGNGWGAEVTVGAEHGLYQNYGTGVFGPMGRPLVADELTGGWQTSRGTQVHRFVFDWPAAGGIVFARTVQGTEATHWWERTIDRWPEALHS